jgi:hypothetical protein
LASIGEINLALSHRDTEQPIESYLKPNWYIYWQGQTYRIISRNLRVVTVEHTVTLESSTFRVVELLVPEGETPPIFASTLEKLHHKLSILTPVYESSTDADLPPPLRAKAEFIVKTFKDIEKRLIEKKDGAERAGEIFRQSDALNDICRDLGIARATYYNYRNTYLKHRGDRAAIAASFRRSTFGHTSLLDPQIYFIDSAILHFYKRKPAIRKATLYEAVKSTYEHTGGRWIDPNRCGEDIPQDLVIQLFDDKLPIQALLENPEKARLLVPVELPGRTWVYDRVNALEMQPDEGKALIVARYGESTWEYEQMLFDHFAHIATKPLQYVFGDYHLLKVFVVDEETRSEPDRLWLTLFIDAYSRSILGLALTYESPCIDSIQDALLNAVYPKDSLLEAIWPEKSFKDLGSNGGWPCYGIPLQLSLDNAWSNHSHSLESLASIISQSGEFNSIDLVFRKPYKARQGALIERYFGTLSAIVKERLKGAIQSSHPRDIRNAAEEACLLYEDVYRFVVEEIVAYQNRVHSELKMTPNQKWAQGWQSEFPQVPSLTLSVRRQFWRLYHETREIRQKGISLFGLHYWSSQLGGPQAPKAEQNGQTVKYAIRYNPSDISCIAIFRNGRYACDVKAKELRLSNGEYRSVSIWERELSKDLARSDNQASRDWLAYLNRLRDLQEKRTTEKKAAKRKANQSKSKAPPKKADVKVVDEAIQQITTLNDQEYGKRIARFGRH